MPLSDPIPEHAVALADALRVSLKRIIQRIRQESESDPSGLSLHQKMLLATISHHPGIGVAELARMEKLRGPTMSGHVKALENAGLVRRDAPDPADRRRVGLHLSDHGRTLIEDIRGRNLDWLARKLAALPPEGADALRQAIIYLDEIGQ